VASDRAVICPIDFSPLSKVSLSLAVEMCRRTGARLVLEHNLESRPPSYLTVGWMWAEEHEGKEQDKSERAVEGLRRLFDDIPEGVEYEAKITRGPVEAGILYLAKDLPADLIVMGTHGPSDADHKSITERIIIQAPCPVLTTGEAYRPESIFGVEGGPEPEGMTILVPFDFTSRSRAVLRFAIEMAQRMPHKIHLLHVVPPRTGLRGEPEDVLEVDDVTQRLQELVPDHLGDRVESRVLVGEPVPRILEEAARINALFILMAAHGKGPLKRMLFGTTTLEVLHGSECPVWFLPPAVTRAMA
jgi:universal stress protein A